MAEQNAQTEQEAQKLKAAPASLQAQAPATPPPSASALKPDKTVLVPEFAVCMASEPYTEKDIEAFLAREKKK